MLTLHNLHFRHPGAATPLINGLSAHIPAGITLVCGGDGSGKSTLLRLLAGELHASQGSVDMPGIGSSQVFWADPRSDALADALNDVVVAAHFEALATRWPALSTAWLGELVDALGLGPHLHKPMFMLSTGSQRKVLLAAALASGAPVTLLDEPLAALDAPSARAVTAALVRAANSAHRAIVVADHTAPPGVPVAQVITLG